MEIQIRTQDMQEHAEYGIASHISYKEGAKRGKKPESFDWVTHLLPKQNFKEVVDGESVPSHQAKFQDVPHWIKDLVEHQHNESDPENFKEDLKSDFFQYRIFVFTPLGDVVDLPKDSTAIDFAYSIHSDIGNHMSGVKVNGKLVALNTMLSGGDVVEIITKKSAKPNRKWIEDAKTTMAKRHIRITLGKESRKGLI